MPTKRPAPAATPLRVPHRLLTISEVVSQLGMSRSTVYRAIHAGRLEAVHLGFPPVTRIRQDELDRYIATDRPALLNEAKGA